MSNILAKKLPQNEENFAALLQTMKGEMTIMGLEKVLDDIEQRGIQTGIRQGIQEGLQEGRLVGQLEGQRAEREAIAKRMLNLGVEISVIAAATGFSTMEIEQL